jgi:hypothetical protein
MDVVVVLGIILMLGLAIFHISVWKRESWKLASTYLRSASLMLVCFTLLTVLLFGMRIFLKPEVSVAYNDTTADIYSNVLTTKDGQIQESKKLLVCDVTFKKFYPLSVFMGRDDKAVRYKTPCSELTIESKTDIADIVGYLKEEHHNAGK